MILIDICFESKGDFPEAQSDEFELRSLWRYRKGSSRLANRRVIIEKGV